MLFATPYITEYSARLDILTFPHFDPETERQCFLKRARSKSINRRREAAPMK
jgi:hypothetical protein